MDNQSVIYQAIVGSTMHGLKTETSDEDVRYITLPTLRQIVSPFKNDQIKVRDGNGDDEESWSLSHFCRHLTQGNPTVYEVIRTDHYDKNLPNAELIRSLMPLAFDGVKIMYAHIGYAEAQLKRYLRKADHDLKESCYILNNQRTLLGMPKYESDKKGNLKPDGVWEENHLRRIPKSVVAGYRVIAQGTQLLKTGDFLPVVKDYSAELHDKLMAIKTMDANDITWGFVKEHLNGIEEGIQELKTVYSELPESTQHQKPNIEAIEDVLCSIYGIS